MNKQHIPKRMYKNVNHEHNMTPAGKSLYSHLLRPSSFKTQIFNSPYWNSPRAHHEMILNKCVNLSNQHCSSSWAFFIGCACLCTYLETIFGEQLGLRPIHSRAAQYDPRFGFRPASSNRINTRPM